MKHIEFKFWRWEITITVGTEQERLNSYEQAALKMRAWDQWLEDNDNSFSSDNLHELIIFNEPAQAHLDSLDEIDDE